MMLCRILPIFLTLQFVLASCDDGPSEDASPPGDDVNAEDEEIPSSPANENIGEGQAEVNESESGDSGEEAANADPTDSTSKENVKSEFMSLCQSDQSAISRVKTINALLSVAATSDCDWAFEQLWALKHLSLSGHGISDIEPIQIFSNLVSLDISDNNIKSLEGIENLSELAYLNLSKNPLAEINGISHIRQVDIRSTKALDDIDSYDLPASQVLYLTDDTHLGTSASEEPEIELDPTPGYCEERRIVFETQACRHESHELEDLPHRPENVEEWNECRHPEHGWEAPAERRYTLRKEVEKFVPEIGPINESAMAYARSPHVCGDWYDDRLTNFFASKPDPRNYRLNDGQLIVRHAAGEPRVRKQEGEEERGWVLSSFTCVALISYERARLASSEHCGAKKYKQRHKLHPSVHCPETGNVRIEPGHIPAEDFAEVGPSVCDNCRQIDVGSSADVPERVECYERILTHERVPAEVKSLTIQSALEFGHDKAKWMDAATASVFWKAFPEQ